ncbi:hypothetical protein AMTRI_Chr13g125630 [Amborella trichopoda]
MQASLEGRYETKLSSSTATIAMKAGELRFRASCRDSTFTNGPKLEGLNFSVEKPGSFILDYSVPDEDMTFQFMNAIKVNQTPLKINYTHKVKKNSTLFSASLAFDPDNTLSGSYNFGNMNTKVRYKYNHGGGARGFELGYDFDEGFDFALSHKVFSTDTLKASYGASKQIFQLDYAQAAKDTGSFKITATVDLKEEKKVPKLTAMTTWSFDLL